MTLRARLDFGDFGRSCAYENWPTFFLTLHTFVPLKWTIFRVQRAVFENEDKLVSFISREFVGECLLQWGFYFNAVESDLGSIFYICFFYFIVIKDYEKEKGA